MNPLSPLEVLSVREALRHPRKKMHTAIEMSELPVENTLAFSSAGCLQSCLVRFWVGLSPSTLGPGLPGKPSAPRSPLGPFRDTRF